MPLVGPDGEFVNPYSRAADLFSQATDSVRGAGYDSDYVVDRARWNSIIEGALSGVTDQFEIKGQRDLEDGAIAFILDGIQPRDERKLKLCIARLPSGLALDRGPVQGAVGDHTRIARPPSNNLYYIKVTPRAQGRLESWDRIAKSAHNCDLGWFIVAFICFVVFVVLNTTHGADYAAPLEALAHEASRALRGLDS